MDGDLFKIIFLGDLVDVEKRGVVTRNLATLFGSTAGTLDSLFTRSPVLLKKNLTRDEAIRFRDAIVRCGAYCRVEAMEPGDSASENITAIAKDHAGEQFNCPRCGEAQARSPLCRYCGALVQEYQERADAQSESEEELNRRYYERRQDLETAVNVDDHDERRKGRDRRRAQLNWRR
jgi:predicted RNA-binding Zn-ribbon protein involved in translation (DUF1610 family)